MHSKHGYMSAFIQVYKYKGGVGRLTASASELYVNSLRANSVNTTGDSISATSHFLMHLFPPSLSLSHRCFPPRPPSSPHWLQWNTDASQQAPPSQHRLSPRPPSTSNYSTWVNSLIPNPFRLWKSLCNEANTFAACHKPDPTNPSADCFSIMHVVILKAIHTGVCLGTSPLLLLQIKSSCLV